LLSQLKITLDLSRVELFRYKRLKSTVNAAFRPERLSTAAKAIDDRRRETMFRREVAVQNL
jgi:hypothetical protein